MTKIDFLTYYNLVLVFDSWWLEDQYTKEIIPLPGSYDLDYFDANLLAYKLYGISY